MEDLHSYDTEQTIARRGWHSACSLSGMSRLMLFAIVTGMAFAQPRVELEGRYWFSEFNSAIRVERNGLGTDIDARNDLGFSDSGFPSGRAAVYLGHSRLSFEYTPIDFSGDQTVSRTLIYNGRTYTFGTRVISGMEVRHLQLSWIYQFRLLEGRLKIGPLAEAHGFLLKGRLQAPEVNVDSEEDLSVGLPTAGLALEISPRNWVDIYGEASGMSVGDYGHFIRSEVGLRVRPVSHLQLSAGYRTFNLRVDASADFARLHLRGPFLGAGFRW
jgi:hypothetical protein